MARAYEIKECEHNSSFDWSLFQDSVQWQLLLFQQITSSPHPFPPITNSQLGWEKSLLKTQEAVTTYKSLPSQNICHSLSITILKKSATSGTYWRKVLILGNIVVFFSLALLSWWNNKKMPYQTYSENDLLSMYEALK